MPWIFVIALGLSVACGGTGSGPCPDLDGDGVCDTADVCPDGDDGVDGDGDSIPDACDLCAGHDDAVDGDGDSVPDGCDLCAGHDDAVDGDGDSVPDGCDLCAGHDDAADGDGDSVPDGCDPCPADNPDDSDGDGVCDADDICSGGDDALDDDGDTVPDYCDVCPDGDDTIDSDGDGVPDACDDLPCTGDAECPESMYCDGAICVDDTCTPGFRTCLGQEVYECLPNGSADALLYACDSGSYFQSTCVDGGLGRARCTCAAGWDCPAGLECLAGLCEGTLGTPVCTVPPTDLWSSLPTPEIVWGGEPPYPGASTYASQSPFSEAAQVVMTPLVANLNDDNGDGRIDERDVPEILFIAFRSHEYSTNGVLRAIHGGGPNKGADFFATCGATRWVEGDALPATCNYSGADLDSTTSLAVGDLDADGVPEIVAITETNAVRIYSNTGEILATSVNQGFAGANPAPSIANVDATGLAEIIIGRTVLTLRIDAGGQVQFQDRLRGTGTCCHGTNGQGELSCVANLLGDERMEIIAGGRVYAYPRPPVGAVTQADCATYPPSTAEEQAFCDGELVSVWNAAREGFCAVADVLGADQVAAPGPANPLDGVPEVLLVSSGRLRIYNGQDGTELRNLILDGTRGGAPTVGDFDGDGFPEIGSAGSTAYVVTDLQDPSTSCPAWTSVNDDNSNLPRSVPSTVCVADSDCGDVTQFACNRVTQACVCLHNGWLRPTEDSSSQVTGSAVADLNGDGSMEVLYNDECEFRIYSGLTGAEVFSEPSESRTRVENPVVADVDNDGRAEIVFATTNESGFCSQNLDSSYNNGIEVWGDASGGWGSARRIWNQHTYHVTNVTESGAIPRVEPGSWLGIWGGASNTYRAAPGALGRGPDLVVTDVQVTSPSEICGQLSEVVEIAVRVENHGDLRAAPDTLLTFHGDWQGLPLAEPLYADAAQTPLTYAIGRTLEPGDHAYLTVSYDAVHNAPGVLPDLVRVVVDEDGGLRECVESNNEVSHAVVAGPLLPDLTLTLGTPDPTGCPTVLMTLSNVGSADASDVTVRFYAGDPFEGGQMLHDEVVIGTIPAGANAQRDVQIPGFPQSRSIRIWAVVDPTDQVTECNDGNNHAAAPTFIVCP